MVEGNERTNKHSKQQMQVKKATVKKHSMKLLVFAK